MEPKHNSRSPRDKSAQNRTEGEEEGVIGERRGCLSEFCVLLPLSGKVKKEGSGKEEQAANYRGKLVSARQDVTSPTRLHGYISWLTRIRDASQLSETASSLHPPHR